MRSARSSGVCGFAAPGQVAIEVGAREDHGDAAPGTARDSARRNRALRRACRAMSASAGAPSHCVCTITRNRSRSISAQRAAVRQLPLFAVLVPGVTMHTTGLEALPIGQLYEGSSLAAALSDARARTLALYGHLDLERLEVPCIPIVNPAPVGVAPHRLVPGDTGASATMRARESRCEPSILPHADALFDSSAVAARYPLEPGPALVGRVAPLHGRDARANAARACRVASPATPISSSWRCCTRTCTARRCS